MGRAKAESCPVNICRIIQGGRHPVWILSFTALQTGHHFHGTVFLLFFLLLLLVHDFNPLSAMLREIARGEEREREKATRGIVPRSLSLPPSS